MKKIIIIFLLLLTGCTEVPKGNSGATMIETDTYLETEVTDYSNKMIHTEMITSLKAIGLDTNYYELISFDNHTLLIMIYNNNQFDETYNELVTYNIDTQESQLIYRSETDESVLWSCLKNNVVYFYRYSKNGMYNQGADLPVSYDIMKYQNNQLTKIDSGSSTGSNSSQTFFVGFEDSLIYFHEYLSEEGSGQCYGVTKITDSGVQRLENHCINLNKEDKDPVLLYYSLASNGISYALSVLTRTNEVYGKTLIYTSDYVEEIQLDMDNNNTLFYLSRHFIVADSSNVLTYYSVGKESAINTQSLSNSYYSLWSFQKDKIIIELSNREERTNYQLLIYEENSITGKDQYKKVNTGLLGNYTMKVLSNEQGDIIWVTSNEENIENQIFYLSERT